MAQMPLFNLFVLGLGWPWVGEFVGFIIMFIRLFPNQHNLIYRNHPTARTALISCFSSWYGCGFYGCCSSKKSSSPKRGATGPQAHHCCIAGGFWKAPLHRWLTINRTSIASYSYLVCVFGPPALTPSTKASRPQQATALNEW